MDEVLGLDNRCRRLKQEKQTLRVFAPEDLEI